MKQFSCFINALIDLGVDSNEDGLISYAEAEALESLSFWDDFITDLKGIEAFVNLTHLYCYTYNVKRVDLSANTKLTSLGILGQYDTLDLSNNPLLNRIFFRPGEISFLDVSNITSLQFLDCARNQLTELDASRNPHLEQLFCESNQLTNLDLSNSLIWIFPAIPVWDICIWRECRALRKSESGPCPSLGHHLIM